MGGRFAVMLKIYATMSRRNFSTLCLFSKAKLKQTRGNTLEFFIHGFDGFFYSLVFYSGGSRNSHEGEPSFSYSIKNISAVIGKDAVLHCFVESLGMYKVGWMRSDQTGKMILHCYSKAFFY